MESSRKKAVVMQILDVDISDYAAKQIDALCNSFRQPVKFLHIEEAGSETGAARDSTDPRDSMCYKVYLPSGLDRRMFEANVLYELFHIRQFEAGFPTLGRKDSVLFSEDREFVEELGGLIFSGALDLEIYERLCKCRYNDAVRWFGGNIYTGLVSAASYKFSNLDDKYNFAHLVITFVKVLYHTDNEQDAKIRELFADYPLVLERSFEVRDMLLQNDSNTPESVAIIMGRILSILELWDLFNIRISDLKIRTKTEFESFCALHEC